MDILAIILACSLHPDDELVRILVDVQSNGNAYFVGDLATLKTNDSLASAAAALRFAEDLRRHGGRPAVGLLGIPLEWAGRYGRAPIELFDACTNISVATSSFAEYQDRCTPGRWRSGRSPMANRHRRGRRTIDPRPLRLCVLQRFARDLGLASAPAAILQRLTSERAAQPFDHSAAPPQQSFIFLGGSGEAADGSASSGSPRIFLDASAKSSAAP
jgi:hypothetical protein